MSWTTSLPNRFDTNYIAKIGKIELNNPHPQAGMPSWYSGWSIVRVGVKTCPNFSGTMATLVDFHKAMKTLDVHARCNVYANAQEALAEAYSDGRGVQDISQNGRRMLPRNLMRFREFRVYSEMAYYTTPDGHKNRYEVLTLTKKNAGTHDFFIMQIPANCVTNLVLALEMLLEANNMKPLECGVLNAPTFADKLTLVAQRRRTFFHTKGGSQPPKEEEEVEEEVNVEEEAVVDVKRECKTPKKVAETKKQQKRKTGKKHSMSESEEVEDEVNSVSSSG